MSGDHAPEIFGPYLVDGLEFADGVLEHHAARREVDGGMWRACRLRRLDLGRVEDPSIGARLTEEARLLIDLRHPGIVATLDYGVIDGELFIEEERIDGVTLREMLDRLGRLPPAIALLITARLAEVLAYAHDATTLDGRELHVVHRNLKPTHVRITPHGETKLAGFGTAHFRGRLLKTSFDLLHQRIRYSCPEAIRGEPVDARSDLFGLGILLYEMVAGLVPFQVFTFDEAREALSSGEYVAAGEFVPDLDERVEELIGRLLQVDPLRRPASGREVWTACWSLRREIGDPRDEGRLRQLVGKVLTPGDDISLDDF